MATTTLAGLGKFIDEAPPGELQEVFKDVKVLLDGNEARIEELRPSFVRHNEAQLATLRIPGQPRDSLLAEELRRGEGYVDALLGKQFTVDHVTMLVSNVEDLPEEEGEEGEELGEYVKEYYPGQAAYTLLREGDTLRIFIVGNRYSPRNFWSGRWRSKWEVQGQTLRGRIQVDVHYYEDGNVRMQDEHEVEMPITSSAVAAIHTAEHAYQDRLVTSLLSLNDSFKRLRRQLPITRQRINWDNLQQNRLHK